MGMEQQLLSRQVIIGFIYSENLGTLRVKGAIGYEIIYGPSWKKGWVQLKKGLWP
jgi:hypothetical protein